MWGDCAEDRWKDLDKEASVQTLKQPQDSAAGSLRTVSVCAYERQIEMETERQREEKEGGGKQKEEQEGGGGGWARGAGGESKEGRAEEKEEGREARLGYF